MKKVVSVFYAILAMILLTTSVLAGPSIKLSGGANSVEWSLGSLVAEGALIVGNTDVKVILQASGIPEITCTNQGMNPAPGQNPPSLSAAGAQVLQDRDKNGKSPFNVEAVPPATLPGSQGGCPNDNWTAHVGFVSWKHALITVKDPVSGEVLLQQPYECATTRNPDTVSCWAVE